MERAQARERYKLAIIDQYQDAEQNIRFNDDPDLKPIWVPLPEPPDWKFVEGFGLAPKDQRWKRPVPPKKLAELMKNGKLTIDQIWTTIESSPDAYAESVEFIKKMWYFRLHGYWFFCHGRPTYITGKHFYYLTSFQIDEGYPRYRDRDRKYWIFIDFCREYHWDFVKKDKEGYAIPEEEKEEDGTPIYLIKDVGRRTCYGDVYPKMRREGATYRAECNNLETISKKMGADGGIQSRTDDDSEEVFLKKLVRPWKRVPFYFKPIYSGSTNPKTVLDFDVPAQKVGSGKSIAAIGFGLESKIDFGPGDEGYYDGHKLYFFHDDEVGKNVKYDVVKRHSVTKECLATEGGYNIIGYTSKTSTAGEMEKGGGRQFERLCAASDYYKRNEMGQTDSGLFRLFISSADGVRSDEYGQSDVETNKRMLEDKRLSFLRAKDVEGWIGEIQKFPIYYRECFMTSASDLGFNLQILSERIGELRHRKPLTKRGMLVRDNPADRTSSVRFVESAMGRWVMSQEPIKGSQRQYMSDADGQYRPYRTNYFVGADAFRFDQAEDNRMSDGGIVVKWGRDKLMDSDEKPIEEWSSDLFVCTYQFRPPTTDEFAEDVLKTCQYYGAQVLAEENADAVIKKFKEWGFGGYLIFMKDSSGKYRNKPGFYTGGNNKEQIFNANRDYIERRGRFDRHIELLEDFNTIRSMKEMTKFDRFTAAGLSEIACNASNNLLLPAEEVEEEVEFPFEERDF